MTGKGLRDADGAAEPGRAHGTGTATRFQTLEQVIDDNPVSPLQVFTIVTCGVLGLLDGFDTQLIAFVAPAIIQDWGLQPSSFTPIFVAGGIGSLAASLPFGSVADKYGRRLCLMIVTVIAALGTLATPFVTSREQLLVCRLVTSFPLISQLTRHA